LAAFLGDEGQGAAVRTALELLCLVPAESLAKAVKPIDRETTLGPLLHPSAYLDGRRFDNAAEYTKVLRAVRDLRRLLPNNKRGTS
jgi:hypothetical protein